MYHGQGENGDDQDELRTGSITEEVFPHVFVTVGTTFYDELITWALEEDTVNQFLKMGVNNVKLQIGSSKIYSEGSKNIGSISYQFYSYKANLSDDYEWADLVIGHAGAGTVLDVLDRGKTLFVIPNESLMDNHQVELGEAIHAERYAYSSKLVDADSMLKKIKRSGLKKFPIRNIPQFHQLLEEVLNLDPVQLASAKTS